MLAVAFALRGTLVADRGLEHATVAAILDELSAHHAHLRLDLAPEARARLVPGPGPAAVPEIAARLAELVEAEPGKQLVRTLSARYRQIAAALVPDYFATRDGAAETLGEIAKLGIPAAILTNAIEGVAVAAAALAGFAGRVLAAEDIGHAKPAAAAYAALADAFGLPARNIYYVSADPSDIAAAHDAGLTTVLLEDAARSGAAAAPAHTIASLPALLPLLAEPYARGMLSLRYVMHSALAWRPGHYVPGNEYCGPGETDD
jgi:FMN phosphatase YigB (HAD superfamily)